MAKPMSAMRIKEPYTDNIKTGLYNPIKRSLMNKIARGKTRANYLLLIYVAPKRAIAAMGVTLGIPIKTLRNATATMRIRRISSA
jgi:hypothetical protein